MEIFDNVTRVVKDDLETTIGLGCRVSIAAACFSIYAYQELKKQLDNIDEMRFIFTSPALTVNEACMEQNLKLSSAMN